MLARGRAGGDDRERRRAWPACRSARCRSTTRSRSISPGRSCKATEADLGAGGDRSEAEGAARGDGGEARALRPQERQGLLRLSGQAGQSGCGRGSRSCSRRKLDPDTIDIDELKHRLLAVQALEAARCVEEGVITDVREADVGSILGFGFAPFTGGTLSYIDRMGAKPFVELCQAAGEKTRRALPPPKLLRDMAAKGETFYGRFAPRGSRRPEMELPNLKIGLTGSAEPCWSRTAHRAAGRQRPRLGASHAGDDQPDRGRRPRRHRGPAARTATRASASTSMSATSRRRRSGMRVRGHRAHRRRRPHPDIQGRGPRREGE